MVIHERRACRLTLLHICKKGIREELNCVVYHVSYFFRFFKISSRFIYIFSICKVSAKNSINMILF